MAENNSKGADIGREAREGEEIERERGGRGKVKVELKVEKSNQPVAVFDKGITSTQASGFTRTTTDNPMLIHNPHAHSDTMPLLDRYCFTRRTAILLLLLAIHYFLLVDWYQSPLLSDGKLSNFRVPIRGGIGIRPQGEICGEGPEGPIKIHNRFAIVFDAGSTGSRVHIYEFQFCGPFLKTLVDEVFEEVKPGLSHYKNDPGMAAQSLEPLLHIAAKRVPPPLHQCTPLVVKATAGLRLLPADTVDAILTSVSSHLAHHTFLFGISKPSMQSSGMRAIQGKANEASISTVGAVTVIDGSEEATCAWMTVNFLMNKPETSHSPQLHIEETAVVMDLGGGSTQIVFAVDAIANNGTNDRDPDRSQYYSQLRLNGQDVNLYQHSYLGYGLMEARKRIKTEHIERMLAGSENEHTALRFPCNLSGWKETITLPSTMGKTISYELVGDGAGWDACMAIVSPIFHKDQSCASPPCAFNGVHQPPIKAKNYVAFSYFFDRVIPLGLTSPVTLFDIEREGRKLCKSAPGHRFALLLEENGQWCLDLVYIYSLLRIGYGLDIDQPITITKQINGYEAGWSLGAALKLLEETPSCPILST